MVIEPRDAPPPSPFQEFFRTEAATGALLVVCACAALVVANSAWADAYQRLWATPVVIAGGGHTLSLTLHQWINDGLMAVFFLLVGLEIKREVLQASWRRRAKRPSLSRLRLAAWSFLPLSMFW